MFKSVPQRFSTLLRKIVRFSFLAFFVQHPLLAQQLRKNDIVVNLAPQAAVRSAPDWFPDNDPNNNIDYLVGNLSRGTIIKLDSDYPGNDGFEWFEVDWGEVNGMQIVGWTADHGNNGDRLFKLRPNLTYLDGSGETNDNPVIVGEEFRLRYNIENDAAGFGHPTKARIRLSDAGGNLIMLAILDDDEVEPNDDDRQSHRFTLPADAPRGFYTAFVDIDHNNTLSELDENDNSFSFQFDVARLPPIPAAISAVQVDGNPDVNIVWLGDESDDTSGYKLERKTNGVGDFAEIENLDSNTFIYDDQGAGNGDSYEYRVKAYGPDGESDYSPIATINTMPPAAVVSITSINPGFLELSTRSQYITVLGVNFEDEPDVYIDYPGNPEGDFDKLGGSKVDFENTGELRVTLPRLRQVGLGRIYVVNPDNTQSEIFAFDIGGLGHPIPMSPPDGGTGIDANSVMLKWGNPNSLPDMTEVRVFFQKVSGYRAIDGEYVESSALPVNSTSYTLTNLIPNQWHLWVVRFTFTGGEERYKFCWFRTGSDSSALTTSSFSWADDSAVTKREGNLLSLRLWRSGNAFVEQVVNISTVDGEADESDFTLNSPRVVFPLGETEKTVFVELKDDEISESTEHFFLRIDKVDGVTPDPVDVLRINILNRDPAPPATGTITGVINNTAGANAPAVEISVSGRSGATAVASNGTFTISDVATTGFLTLTPKVLTSGGTHRFDPPQRTNVQSGQNVTFDLIEVTADANPDRDDNQSMTRIADPIDAATGAQVITLPLLSLHGLRPVPLSLGYNSLERLNAGTLGYGWFHNFERSLVENADGTITYRKTPNLSYTFSSPIFGSGIYTSTNPDLRYVTLQQNENQDWVFKNPDQSTLLFNTEGQVISAINAQGQSLILSHQNNLLHRVTEPITGVYWEFSYNSGLISSISDGFGRSFNLTIESSILTKITYPISSISRSFDYTPPLELDIQRIFDVESPEIVDQADPDFPGGRLIFDNTHDAQGRITAQEDGRPGNPGGFAYSTLANGNTQTVYTDRMGHSYTYEFTSQLNMVKLTRPDTKVVSQTFDDNGDLKTLTLPGRNPIVYDYAGSGGISSIVDPVGNETNITLDGRNNPLSVIDALDKETELTFNDLNLPTTVSDELDQTTEVRYNGSGQALQEENQEGDCTDMVYAGGRLLYIDSPDNRRITIGRDDYGRPNSWTNSENETISVEYDDLDRIIRYTDEEDFIYSMKYDGQNNILKLTTPLPDTDNPGEFHAYDFEYDGNRNLVKTINPAVDGVRSFTEQGYDFEDRLIWTKDERGHLTSLVRDSLGRVEGYRDSQDKGVDLLLDDYGNTLEVTDTLGRLLSKTTYNDLNLAKTWTSDEGRDLTLEYDDSLQLKWIQRVDGKKRNFFYDAIDRLDYEETSLGRKTKYGYDPVSAVEKIFQQTKNVTPETLFTKYVRNANREIEEVITPLQKSTRYERDQIGRVDEITREDDSVRSFEYYDRGLLETDTIGASVRSYTYDELGRKSTSVEGAKSLEWQYDPLGRVDTYTDHFGDDVEYDWWPNHLLKRITYEPGIYVDYFYDTRNLLNIVRDWENREIVYTYYDNHLLHTATYPNGLIETRTYNLVQELKTIILTKPDGTIVWDYELGRNNLGLIDLEARDPRNTPEVSLTTFRPSTPDPEYNEDNMVISIDGIATMHDGRRNLTSVTIDENPDQFTYSARDELESFDGLWYTYNSDGDKVRTAADGVTVDYRLDGAHPLRRVLSEKRSDRLQPTYYIYGLGLCYSVTGNDIECYTFDIRGSARLLTNTAGERTNVFDYSPYGTLTKQLAPPETPFLYNGKYGVRTERDGLLYMRARHFSPKLRRFLSTDLIGQSGGLNTFAYADGNPIGFVDPFGLVADSVEEYQQGDIPGWYRVSAFILGNSLNAKLSSAHYSSLIEKEAEQRGLNPDLISAVILNESITRFNGGFTEAAYSYVVSEKLRGGAGTYGPAQLGSEAREESGLSRLEALNLENAIIGASTWLEYYRDYADSNGYENPSDIEIATLYNSGPINLGEVSKYGRRIQWLLNNYH